MPVMDGLVATEKILALDVGIPIVAMTANIMYDDKEFYKSNGMSDCVGKPFTSQELWGCLMRFFKPVSWQKEDPSRLEQADNELHQKLINNFVKNNSSKVEEIAQALEEGDIKTAHRLAHSLKNNAGQLKKTSLKQAAEEVESQLAGGVNLIIPRHLEILDMELKAALAELEPLVYEAEHSEDTREPLDDAASIELMNNIEPLLESFNTECLVFVDDLRMVPGSSKLITHMQNLDFILALESFAELKKAFGQDVQSE
jgi:HPt (histidine-containing phosphotransfer) domain-containing protein